MFTFSVVSIFFLSRLSAGSSFLMPYAPRYVTQTLKVTNGGYWGGWGPPQYCAEGTYAVGYSMKIESVQGGGDDTSLNSIALTCKGLDGERFGGQITSYEGSWGHWYDEESCDKKDGTPTFLTAFALQVERPINGDDTAANYVKFKCRDFAALKPSYEIRAPPGRGSFGTMGSWSADCTANSAICGLRTRIEKSLGRGDDTAFNNVEFYCCVDNPETGK